MRQEKPEAGSQEPEWLLELPAAAIEHGELRDGIAERLERFRQAPHARLANLLGVQKKEGRWFLVWQNLDGHSLEAANELDEDQIYRALREMIDAIEALHQLGLVHGNLRSDNVIVTANGIFLTDVSPLLWSDERMDIDAAREIVRSTLARRRFPGPGADVQSLRALAAFLDGGYVPESVNVDSSPRLDRRVLALAIALIILAVTIASVIAWYLQRPSGKLLQSAVYPLSPSPGTPGEGWSAVIIQLRIRPNFPC